MSSKSDKPDGSTTFYCTYFTDFTIDCKVVLPDRNLQNRTVMDGKNQATASVAECNQSNLRLASSFGYQIVVVLFKRKLVGLHKAGNCLGLMLGSVNCIFIFSYSQTVLSTLESVRIESVMADLPQITKQVGQVVLSEPTQITRWRTSQQRRAFSFHFRHHEKVCDFHSIQIIICSR